MQQEFAVTVSAAILVSVLVSLTLTPMLCALLLKPEEKDVKHGRLHGMAERRFDWMLARYAAALAAVLRRPLLALLAMIGPVALTGVLLATIPKASSRSRTRA